MVDTQRNPNTWVGDIKSKIVSSSRWPPRAITESGTGTWGLGLGDWDSGTGTRGLGLGDVRFGDVEHGDVGHGNVGHGNVGHGNVGHGDVGLGDVGLGDVGLGDARTRGRGTPGLGDVINKPDFYAEFAKYNFRWSRERCNMLESLSVVAQPMISSVHGSAGYPCLPV